MAEVEGILRIIEALKKDVPVFCVIDEIFREQSFLKELQHQQQF